MTKRVKILTIFKKICKQIELPNTVKFDNFEFNTFHGDYPSAGIVKLEIGWRMIGLLYLGEGYIGVHLNGNSYSTDKGKPLDYCLFPICDPHCFDNISQLIKSYPLGGTNG